jgi:CSLREA domain-containing protein
MLIKGGAVAHSNRRLSALVLLILLASFAPSATAALAASFVVTKAADTNDGTCNADCSLREAITAANSNPGPDTISFAIPADAANGFDAQGFWRLALASNLPPLSGGGTTIQGPSASDAPATSWTHPRIVLDGSATLSANGLLITSANNVVRRLTIVNYNETTFTGSGGSAIVIEGAAATENRVEASYIGVDPANGSSSAGNDVAGVQITNGASRNTIGGATAAERNVISGNGRKSSGFRANVYIATSTGPASDANVIQGNYIGTNPAGTAQVTGGNLSSGVWLGDDADNTIVAGNLFAGLAEGGGRVDPLAGVLLNASSAAAAPQNARIRGNIFGLAAGGQGPSGNALYNSTAIRVQAAAGTLIGGATAAERNIISGSGYAPPGATYEPSLLAGVHVTGTNATGTVIEGNYIGLDIDGDPLGLASGLAIGNLNYGVNLTNNSSGTIVRGNVISNNASDGVHVSSGGNTVENNLIGTDISGTTSTANTNNTTVGVRVDRGDSNIIRGNTIAAGFGGLAGVVLKPFSNVSVTNTTVQNNRIGLNTAGASLVTTVADESVGVVLDKADGSATGVTTGATISGNTIGGLEYGVKLEDSANGGHTVRANTIGPTRGPTGLPGVSAGFGIWLFGASGNTIGGPAAADGNTVFGAGSHGIFLDGAGAGDNDIQNNTVRDNGGDGVRVRAAAGVLIDRTATRDNGGAGIALAEGGNGDMPAPTFGASPFVATPAPQLNANIPGGVCGPSGCTIQVFTSATSQPGEGPRFLAQASVAAGATTVAVPVPACDRFLTATLRNNTSGNTSPFSVEVDTTTGCGAASLTLSDGVRVAPGYTAPGPVPAGQTVVYEYTVTNTGGLPATVTIARTGGSFPTSDPTPNTLTVNGGASQTFRVTVDVPADAPGGASDSFTVTVTGGATPLSVTTTTVVAQTFGVDIAAVPPQDRTFASGGVTLSYTHLITNTGNGPDSFTVSTAPTPALSGIAVTELTSCTNVAAGASCRVRVDVPIPATAEPSYTITVTATSQGDPTKSDTAVNRAVGQAAAPGLDPENQIKDALPGETVEFTRTVTNVGTETGDFTASVNVTTPPAGWSATIDPTTPFNLAPGAQQVITHTAVVPPLSASTPLSGTLVNALVAVTSDDNIAASGTDTVRIRLLPRFELAAADTPQTAAPGATVIFTHTLRNLANGPDSFTLLITPTAGLENVTVTPLNPVMLERDGEIDVVVRARVRDFQAPGPQSIEISAQTRSNPKPAPAVQTDVVNVASVAGISLSPPQTALVSAVPDTVSFTHVLTNVGNVSGDFVVAPVLLGSPAGWAVGAVTEDPAGCLTGLASGATCEFTVTVNVPDEPLPLSRDYQLRIDVTTSGASASVTDIVTVEPIAGIAFAPDRSGSTAPDTPIEYTHTLTNTGNITATFTMSVDSAPPGWADPQLIPQIVPDLGPGLTATVTVRLTPPANAPAGGPFDTIVRATSSVGPAPSATVTDSTSVLSAPAGRLAPPAQARSVFPTATQSDTATFNLTLANSGNTVISYTLGIVPVTPAPGWTALITPTTTGLLPANVNTTRQLTVTVTAPAGGGGAQAFRVEARHGLTDDLLATAVVTASTSAPITDLLTPKENNGIAAPGETLVYTHTLKNVRAVSDTFQLTYLAPFGWETVLAPSSVFLPAGGSATVAIGIRVPTSIVSGTLDITTLTATSVSDPSITASATERTTIRRVTAGVLSPRFVQSASPGQTIEFRHTLVNLGNALDTFTIRATSSLGWPVTVLNPTVQLAPAGFDNFITVRLTVPADAPLGAVNRITITATAQSGATIVSGVENVVAIPLPAEERVYPVLLPVVMR